MTTKTPFSFAVTAAVIAPLPAGITVEGLGRNIADGDKSPSASDGTRLGSTLHNGAPLTATFTVRNTGTGPLILGGPSLPAGYTLIEPLNSTIAVGGSDDFTVQLSTATVGTLPATSALQPTTRPGIRSASGSRAK